MRAEKLGEVAAEFDAVHSIERAREVGSVHAIIPAARLRPYLIDAVPARDAADAGGPPRRRMTSHPFGTGWRFGPPAGSDRPEFDDSGFAEVTLPHTVVPLSWRDWDPSAWERVWMYRKRFDAPPAMTPGRRWPTAISGR